MSERERTRQQLDPAGTTAVRSFSVIVVVGAFVFAVVMTALARPQPAELPFALGALLAIGASAAIVIVQTSPYRAPFRGRSLAVAWGLGLAATYLSAAASWGVDDFVQDDWGPIVLGLLFIAVGPYRPAREVAMTGVASAIFVGFLALLEAPKFATPAPPLAFVVIAVTPMLAMCFGGVAYSLGVINAIDAWQRRARTASRGVIAEMRDGIARSVQQDRVTILGQDVIPFFVELLARDELTDADRARAAAIATDIRGVMVTEADRSWLETLVEATGLDLAGSPGAAQLIVDDPEGLADSMSTEQRTAIRALLVALGQVRTIGRDDLRIALARDPRDDTVQVDVGIRLTSTKLVPRVAFAPYFALLRAAFTAFEVEFDHPSLRLRFAYEQQ